MIKKWSWCWSGSESTTAYLIARESPSRETDGREAHRASKRAIREYPRGRCFLILFSLSEHPHRGALPEASQPAAIKPFRMSPRTAKLGVYPQLIKELINCALQRFSKDYTLNYPVAEEKGGYVGKRKGSPKDEIWV